MQGGRQLLRALTPHQAVEKALLLDLHSTGLPSITELSEKITMSKLLEIIGPTAELRLTENCIEALKEETGIGVDRRILRDLIAGAPTKVFDYPGRSLRGRTVTHSFLLNLGHAGELPRVPRRSGAGGGGSVPARMPGCRPRRCRW